MSEGELLVEIEDALEQIDGLLPTEQQAWQQDSVPQLSVERLWILVGNAAERYRRSAGISGGVDPWSALYEFRSVLAHQTPSERRPLRVWEESRSDLSALRGDVHAARQDELRVRASSNAANLRVIDAATTRKCHLREEVQCRPRRPTRSRARFENHERRGFGGPAEPAEAGLLDQQL